MGLFDFFKQKTSNNDTPTTAEKETPQSPEAQFNILCDDGVRALQMGEVAYAVKCLSAALQLRDDTRALAFLAEAQFRSALFTEAHTSLEKLVAIDPENINILLLLMRTQEALERYTDMEATCTKVLALTEGNTEQETLHISTLYYRAKAQKALGKIFDAIATLTQTLAARPDFAEALFLRAQVLSDMQQWNEALADTTALAESAHPTEDMLLLHARLLHANGQQEEAEEYFKKTLEFNPFHQEAILALTNFYQQTHRWDKALDLCNETIELIPDFAEIYKQRGGIKLHLGDKLGAADDLKRSLELNPRQAENLEGEFTNTENRMNEHFRNMNPYQF